MPGFRRVERADVSGRPAVSHAQLKTREGAVLPPLPFQLCVTHKFPKSSPSMLCITHNLRGKGISRSVSSLKAQHLTPVPPLHVDVERGPRKMPCRAV